ncbi:MAG TPA: hypothetical protein VI547_05050 [Anaerolineales bacterium]|nr:hypothetical protein [Anaerolineales bacterium]
MTTQSISVLAAIYLVGMVILRQSRFGLIGYLWSAFGFTALGVLISQIGQWNVALGRVEAGHMVALFGWMGLQVGGSDRASIIVPDPTGWSVLNIGVECSALIEAFIFTGLLLFYPRFTTGERIQRLFLGLAATYLINLIRMAVIVGMIHWLGKEAAPIAHAIVARLIFFAGVVVVYWYLLTLPTLRVVRRELEVSGRAVL